MQESESYMEFGKRFDAFAMDDFSPDEKKTERIWDKSEMAFTAERGCACDKCNVLLFPA